MHEVTLRVHPAGGLADQAVAHYAPHRWHRRCTGLNRCFLASDRFLAGGLHHRVSPLGPIHPGEGLHHLKPC
jgi:hypothetical protein